MISQFFIDRPVFAWVLAIVLMLAGAIAAVRLPVMQYPAIAPPQVSINVNYPGASAQTVQDTVVQVISPNAELPFTRIDASARSDAEAHARQVLTDRRGKLDEVTERLLDKEVIEGDELRAILYADAVVETDVPAAEATSAM